MRAEQRDGAAVVGGGVALGETARGSRRWPTRTRRRRTGTRASASSGHTSAWRRMCSTFTVQSNVRSGKRVVHRAHDAQRVVHAVEEVGVAEGHVARARRDLLRDVGDARRRRRRCGCGRRRSRARGSAGSGARSRGWPRRTPTGSSSPPSTRCAYRSSGGSRSRAGVERRGVACRAGRGTARCVVVAVDPAPRARRRSRRRATRSATSAQHRRVEPVRGRRAGRAARRACGRWPRGRCASRCASAPRRRPGRPTRRRRDPTSRPRGRARARRGRGAQQRPPARRSRAAGGRARRCSRGGRARGQGTSDATAASGVGWRSDQSMTIRAPRGRRAARARPRPGVSPRANRKPR